MKPKQPAYFVTGTDTGVGKTYVTQALMEAMRIEGVCVTGMKPVASGAKMTAAGLRNDDALALLRQSAAHGNKAPDYRAVNPYVFEPPIAPHIAADWVDVRIDPEVIARAFNVIGERAELVLVEGIGGWCVPLNERFMLSDLVKRLKLSVILVVGLRLGCINHALSTARLIKADVTELSAWVASQIDPNYRTTQQTLSTLQAHIDAPYLGCLPYMTTFDVCQAAACIDLRALLR